MSVALVLVAAACSNGGQGSAIHDSTTTASTQPAATTTTVDPTKAAILSAYRASWADYISVAESFPVQALDQRLAVHDTGKELVGVRKALNRLSALGHYNVGPTDLAPVVGTINGDTAVITDCIFDHSYEVDARTKAPVEKPNVGHSLDHFVMTRIVSTWYVSDSTIVKSGKTEDACLPAAG